jgi:hypothetical protein
MRRLKIRKRANRLRQVMGATAPMRFAAPPGPAHTLRSMPATFAQSAAAAKYNETAVAIIALLKYGTGVPFQRLERLKEQLGMPLSAVTQPGFVLERS